jgi:hypothetical protein
MGRQVAAAHAPQHRRQRHVRERRARPAGAWEDQIIGLAWITKQGQRRGCKRHTLLLAGLDPIGRHRPHGVLAINLAPGHAAHLTRSGGSEDGELERAGAEAFAHAQISHEGWRIAPIQGGMMLDGAHR